MRNIPQPKRVIKLKRKRRQKMIRLIVLFFILFLSIVGALAYFSFNKRITINKVIVKGTNIINPASVTSLTKRDLQGRILGIFAKNNTFIYPKKHIYKNLLESFPRIKSLSIHKDGNNILLINLTEKLGSYLYCGSEIPITKSNVGEHCYFMNNDGYIFDKAPYFSGDVYFRYYMKVNNDPVIIGQNIMDKNRFHELVRFTDGIKNLGFKPVSLIVKSDGTNLLYLNHNPGKEAPQIIFQRTNNLNKILNNLSTAMKQEVFANTINSHYNILQYIDLRFANKVLYKFTK